MVANPRSTMTFTVNNILMPHRPSRSAISRVALLHVAGRVRENMLLLTLSPSTLPHPNSNTFSLVLSTRTNRFPCPASHSAAASVRLSSVSTLNTSKSVSKPLKPVYLAAFNARTPKHAGQQVALARVRKMRTPRLAIEKLVDSGVKRNYQNQFVERLPDGTVSDINGHWENISKALLKTEKLGGPESRRNGKCKECWKCAQAVPFDSFDWSSETYCQRNNQRPKWLPDFDHIAVSYRWRGSITACHSFWNTSVDSDHALVRCCFSLRFSGVRKMRTPRLAIEKLVGSGVKRNYQNQFVERLPDGTVSDINGHWENISKALLKTEKLGGPESRRNGKCKECWKCAQAVPFDSFDWSSETYCQRNNQRPKWFPDMQHGRTSGPLGTVPGAAIHLVFNRELYHEYGAAFSLIIVIVLLALTTFHLLFSRMTRSSSVSTDVAVLDDDDQFRVVCVNMPSTTDNSVHTNAHNIQVNGPLFRYDFDA
ncbi:transmembrane 9 superfamily protein member [Clonorchis sinensis]|uniref:Transmembrane 9 superfamily protein member n=1 Tax=Clonorchis sinensis TaxID=79923 RepID=G7YR38_CLOSI|nr:transmembrane 9 superfamily protein member [Clonorchis sinensis]